MDLHSGCLYWPTLKTPVPQVSPLDRDFACDVAIIGAGLSGALSAIAILDTGRSVAILDRRELGRGSSAASTGLLQYEIDTPLYELADKVGMESARRAYQLGIGAIDALEELALSTSCPFERVESLYFTRSHQTVPRLRRECRAREQAGLQVQFLNSAQLNRRWGIRAAGAIHSAAAAQTDPYRLTLALLGRCILRGAKVFRDTAVSQVTQTSTGVQLHTPAGHAVQAKFAVHAGGYETARILPAGTVELRSTYALATRPVPSPGAPWPHKLLMWELAEPYLYARWARGTGGMGDRLLIGGEDVGIIEEHARDALIPQKVRTLVDKFSRVVPGLQIEPDYAWAGAFGITHDGLGYIGPLNPGDRMLYALGFGGNGITFAQIAARLLADQIRGDRSNDAEIFRFGR
jgi:glycine/D-amino acid oxidase-like deaminating enzyme